MRRMRSECSVTISSIAAVAVANALLLRFANRWVSLEHEGWGNVAAHTSPRTGDRGGLMPARGSTGLTGFPLRRRACDGPDNVPPSPADGGAALRGARRRTKSSTRSAPRPCPPHPRGELRPPAAALAGPP